MNNTDFQRLLVTNDKALVKELTQPKKKAKDRRPPPEKGKGKGKGKDAKGEGAKGKGGQEPKQPDYRDRAKERRELKGEYETIAAEFENQAEVDLEQSKYLGGDFEHTHLVKGLDFALLSKVRGELNKQAQKEELQEQRAKQKAQKKRTFSTVVAKNVFRAVIETLHPHHNTFSQRLQGMCKALSMGQRIRNAPGVFLPGRMEYEFDTGSGTGPTDIPRIIYISKDDAPSVDQSRKIASVLPTTVGRVSACMQRAAEERKRRKQEKNLGAEATYKAAEKILASNPKPKPIAKDLDDDIFAGVGGFNGAEFAAKEAKKKLEAEAAATKAKAPVDNKAKDGPNGATEKNKSYFDDAGAEKYQTGAVEEQLELDDVAVEERDVRGEDGADVDDSNFEASSKWRGARPGWVFKTGSLGLGYYLDDPKLAARAAAAKANAALLSGSSDRKPLRKAKEVKESSKNAGRRRREEEDDAYGELFPSAMMGHALVMTGEDGSDEEDDSAKKKIEKLKKLAEKDSVSSSNYGKKGKDVTDEKKRKRNENQEWQKIDSMIKKGKVSSIDELEARSSAKKSRAPAPREVFSTPAYF